jgi:carbon storage regulator
VLVLSRRVGEALHIGDAVRIEVLGIRGNQVRIGIVAHPSIPVHREEIYVSVADRRKRREADVGTVKDFEDVSG